MIVTTFNYYWYHYHIQNKKGNLCLDTLYKGTCLNRSWYYFLFDLTPSLKEGKWVSHSKVLFIFQRLSSLDGSSTIGRSSSLSQEKQGIIQDTGEAYLSHEESKYRVIETVWWMEKTCMKLWNKALLYKNIPSPVDCIRHRPIFLLLIQTRKCPQRSRGSKANLMNSLLNFLRYSAAQLRITKAHFMQ